MTTLAHGVGSRTDLPIPLGLALYGAGAAILFGTYGNAVDLRAVSTDAIASVQVLAVVVGHVLGVTLAHERALRAAPHRPASDQLPLVIVMVLYTVGGLGLLFGF